MSAPLTRNLTRNQCQVSNKCPKAMPSSSCEDSDMAFGLVFRWS